MGIRSEITFEVSENMALALTSCFEMAGLTPPKYITSDKMALVIDRIRRNREYLKKLVNENEESDRAEKVTENGVKVNIDANKVLRINHSKKDSAERKVQTVSSEYPSSSFKKAIICSKLGIMRSQIKMTLKKLGYEVFTVNSIQSLNIILEKKQFDLVFVESSDCDNVKDLLKSVLLKGEHSCLMMLSGREDNESFEERCEMMGVNIFIEKNQDWQAMVSHNLNKISNQTLKYA